MKHDDRDPDQREAKPPWKAKSRGNGEREADPEDEFQDDGVRRATERTKPKPKSWRTATSMASTAAAQSTARLRGSRMKGVRIR